MTSELKPIDIWEDATNAVCQIMQESKMCNCPDGECLASTVEPSKETMAQWNTRAVPDVPELARYRGAEICEAIYYGREILSADDGEYVLHSQAVEIIAADRAEKHRAQEAVLKLERELAQYEAQEPVAHIQSRDLKWLSHDNYGSITITTTKSTTHTEPLYVSPVPAADLKAENERLREALKPLVDHAKERNAEGLEWLNSDTVRIPVTIGELRSALNVETIHDKG